MGNASQMFLINSTSITVLFVVSNTSCSNDAILHYQKNNPKHPEMSEYSSPASEKLRSALSACLLHPGKRFLPFDFLKSDNLTSITLVVIGKPFL